MTSFGTSVSPNIQCTYSNIVLPSLPAEYLFSNFFHAHKIATNLPKIIHYLIGDRYIAYHGYSLLIMEQLFKLQVFYFFFI